VKTPGTLRISYVGRKTVFLYRLGDASQVEEMVQAHARHWAQESIRSTENPAVQVVVDIDQSTMRIEWVVGIDTPSEKVTPVPNPFGG
jgi:hypothetical protein